MGSGVDSGVNSGVNRNERIMKNGKVAVIGAGPSGLSACKALAEKGIDFDCLEAGQGVGGIWDVERGIGGGYRSLETNTSTRSMSFSDFPFPKDHTPYGSASQMLAYFESYAKHFDLFAHIEFGQRVEKATPSPDGGWRLELAGGEAREYAAVVAATGQYNFPKRPHEETPGTFAGEILHVFDYLDPSTPVDCRDKTVVVVGLGSSGAEIATELSDPEHPVGSAGHLILSARSGRWVMPKLSGGAPADARAPHPATPLPALLRWLPGEAAPWLMRRVFGKMLRRTWDKFGGSEGLGLPKPTIEPWEDRPTLSVDFIPALKAGRIDVRSGIKRFEGSTVHFDDGSQVDADVILYATGYQLDFPYLDRDVLGCDAPDLALYQRIAHPEHDGLFFVGCCRVMCSLWPLAEQQSKWVARAVAGDFELPDAGKRTKKAVPLATTLPVMCNAYVEDLRREAGRF